MVTGYRIGQLAIDLPARRLTRDGREIHVERKVFDVLVHMCRQPGNVVSRQELLEAVWGRSIASDALVAQVISKLRSLLSHEAGLPEAVATVRGVGYRLDVQPEPVAEPMADNSDDAAAESWWNAGPPLWVFAGLLIFALGLGSIVLQRGQPEAAPARIVLLDMENRTGDSGLEWIGAGATGLMSQVLRQRGLEVISGRQLAALLREADDGADPADFIPRLTGAEYVLAPRLLPADDGFRLELVALAGRAPSSQVLLGQDPATLSLAMADLLADSVRAPLPAPGGAGRLQSAFLNEAYARAFHHQQLGELQSARELLEYILKEEADFQWGQYRLAINYQAEGRFTEARELLVPLLESVVDDAWLAAAVRTTLGNLDWYGGDYESARLAYQDAYQRFETAGLESGMAAALGNLGMVANTLGDFQAGRELTKQSLAIHRRQNNRIQQARTLHNLGYSYKDAGDFDIALDHLRQAYALRTELGLRTQAANSLAAIGETLVQAGQFDEGVSLLREALEVFRDSDNRRGQGVVLADLATAYQYMGRFHQAREMALESASLARLRNEPAVLATVALQLGRIERELSAWPLATQYFDEARAIYTEIDMDRGQVAALIEQARQAAIEGDIAAAAAQLDLFDRQFAEGADPRHVRAARLVRLRLQVLAGEPLVFEQLLLEVLEPVDARSPERADLAAEMLELFADQDLAPSQRAELLRQIEPWKNRYFPAARAAYLSARDPEQCQGAIESLRGLRGEDWSAGLPAQPYCG